jgi:hypothetical protein
MQTAMFCRAAFCDGNIIGFAYDNLGRLVSRTPQTNQISPYDYQVVYDYNLWDSRPTLPDQVMALS